MTLNGMDLKDHLHSWVCKFDEYFKTEPTGEVMGEMELLSLLKQSRVNQVLQSIPKLSPKVIPRHYQVITPIASDEDEPPCEDCANNLIKKPKTKQSILRPPMHTVEKTDLTCSNPVRLR
jgi:hypothetical protein